MSLLEVSISKAKTYKEKISEFEWDAGRLEYYEDVEAYVEKQKDELFKNMLDYSFTQVNEIINYSKNLDMISEELNKYIQHLSHYLNNLQLFENIEKTIDIGKNDANASVNKIQVKGNLTDIVRIFEAMRDANIISSVDGEIKKYGQMFDSENFVANYYSTVHTLNQNQSKSRSKDLINFIKILIEKSYKGKETSLLEIQDFIDKLNRQH
jgi:hypothetical protein